jgi:hypothetical protein
MAAKGPEDELFNSISDKLNAGQPLDVKNQI